MCKVAANYFYNWPRKGAIQLYNVYYSVIPYTRIETTKFLLGPPPQNLKIFASTVYSLTAGRSDLNMTNDIRFTSFR